MNKAENAPDNAYYNIVREALKLYGLQNKNAGFIRHNENLTFKVGNDYLLRIHKPADNFRTVSSMTGMDQMKIREAELDFLRYLQCNGMRVQTPVQNVEGAFVSVLPDGTYATLLTWIPGHIIDKNQVNGELCFKIGHLVAVMQKSAREYENRNALRYNADLMERIKDNLFQNISEASCPDVNIATVLSDACDFIAQSLTDERDFITLHTDLSLSNILITQNGLCPIDFSLFGFAHPMMDIGSLFGCINGVDNRTAIAEGYRSLGLSIDFDMLDVCFAFSVMLYIIMHADNNNIREKGFQNNLARWCRQIFKPLIMHKRLISDTFYMLNAE